MINDDILYNFHMHIRKQTKIKYTCGKSKMKLTQVLRKYFQNQEKNKNLSKKLQDNF